MPRRDLLHLCLFPVAPAVAEGRKRRLAVSGYELSFSTEFNAPKRLLSLVGGDGAGTPDGAAKFPAVMRISHIQAYHAKKAM